MSRRTYRGAPREPRSTGVLTLKLVSLAVAGTIAVGGWIAGRMAAGEDPALGPKAAQANVSKAAGASSGSSSASSYSSSAGYEDDGYGTYSPSGSGYSSSQPSTSSSAPLVSRTS